MFVLTLFILSVGLTGCCNCYQFPFEPSPTLSGDTIVVLCCLAVFGTVSVVGACAICFRRKKTFEKLENEAGAVENIKKNEYPIFRALNTEGGNESSAIVPCERNNLSRDNLLNSSDNLATDNDCGSPRRSDVVDSCEIILIEKVSSPRLQQASRDTITYETEKDIKKLQQASQPSSSTPLLYANNVQSYQRTQPISEQMQQKSASVQLAPESPSLKGFYDETIARKEDDKQQLEAVVIGDASKQEFLVISISDEVKDDSNTLSMNTNPFFNSINANSVIEHQTSKDVAKDDISEVESSVNDNSEKYQILEEETDYEDGKVGQEGEWDETPPRMLQRQNSKGSNCSAGDNNSIEEALRALDIAIGSEDDGEESDVGCDDDAKERMEEIEEKAIFLVDSIVNDCEKILQELKEVSPKPNEPCFEDFEMILNNQNMSTPCAQIKSRHIEPSQIEAAKALFPDGIDISGFGSETFTANDKTYIANDKTFDVNDKTFDSPLPLTELPSIKIDKDENGSEDLTTVTPVNTPIELSYSSETWDKMTCSKGAISKQQQSSEAGNKAVTLESENETITFNQDGWYLHPQAKNDTFEVCEYEEEEGNMDSTYDQLRRQLTEMLPHAQGMAQHTDFLDDDDLNKDSSSPSENYGIKYGELDEATNGGSFELLGALINPDPVATNEMHINYKRPLSPIMEESECDETCRTFVFNNETKLLDSTSTGIMESASAEAQMGQMPKTLMASNDTLFNFEDTLSDQTDNLLMSPRLNTAASSSSSTLSRQESHDKVSLERTPTNEDAPSKIGDIFGKSQELDAIGIMKQSIRQYPLNLDLNSPMPSTSKYEITVAKLALEDGSWPLELPEAQQSINDLSSPEQNKTADSLSFEQDVTYTIDDQKTCISFVLKNDDERISEISEPLFASESLDMLADDDDGDKYDDLITEVDDNFNFEMNDENGNLEIDTKEMELTLKVEEAGSAMFDNDSINPDGDERISKKEFEIDSLEPENKMHDDDVAADSIPNSTVQSANSESDTAVIAATENSSDESDGKDKTKGSSTDIRQVSCNQGMMTTSFTKEWSDDDSSHSSEEFMYVKGGVEGVEGSETKSDEEGAKMENEEQPEKHDNQKQPDEHASENIEIVDVEYNEAYGTWIKHTKQDQIPPTPIFHGDEPQQQQPINESEDESTEEGEFVPSCWDQSLQPKRSSLKSPEREKSEEPPKQSRHVAFKIQRYHSVYEYPCEAVQISPAYSEPQLWSNYMDDASGNIDYFTYTHQISDVASNFPQQIDGFQVSSSSRPFHSANMAQLHNTWPNDSTEFSWSKIQDEAEEAPKPQLHFPLKIEWPPRRSFGLEEDDSDERPDSGVGESSDSPSMGELCHTKGLLRLPLELISSTSSEVSDFMSDHGITKETEALESIANDDDESSLKQPKILLDADDDESDKMILPTPSCTGSMDSLSSNSGSSNSERGPPSFTTFGKDHVLKENEVSGRTSIVFIEDEVEADQDGDEKKIIRKVEVAAVGGDSDKYIKLTLTVGSSDEDSGFENITRMAIK